MKAKTTIAVAAAAFVAVSWVPAAAQSGTAPLGSTPAQPAGAATPAAGANAEPVVPPGYVIGPDDILSIVFWREKDLSTDVVVRPDGKISVPLLNDVDAEGLTPEQLKDRITEQAARLVQDPAVTVVVKQINSRRVFINGFVGKPGAYPLSQSMTVLQLISVAGGLGEYAREDKIVILREENGKTKQFKFNYKQMLEGKNPQQNIELKPGDTILVP